MQNKQRQLRWLAVLLVFSLNWACEQETSPPPIDFVADNAAANYIIAQLNQVPDNSFSEMQQYYGEPLWNEACLEGYEENTTFVIPFMQNHTVQTIVCYKQPTPDDKTLKPVIINHDYLENALFADKFFASLKFHQLKQKGYSIDDCLAEYAVSWLTAETEQTIERSMIKKPEASLKSIDDGAQFYVLYKLPGGSNGNLATDLSTKALTDRLKNVLVYIDFIEETSVYDVSNSWASKDMSYLVLDCNALADVPDFDRWEYIDYAIQNAMYYFKLEMASNYYSVTGENMPNYAFCWYSNTSEGCFAEVASNDLDYLEREYAGAGDSSGGAGGSSGGATGGNTGTGDSDGTFKVDIEADPCTQVEQLLSQDEFVEKMNHLSTLTNEDHETLYILRESLTGKYEYEEQKGPSGTDYVDPDFTNGPWDGYIHNHRTNAYFSIDDIVLIYKSFVDGLCGDLRNVMVGLVKPSGDAYILNINNPDQFINFCEEHFPTPSTEEIKVFEEEKKLREGDWFEQIIVNKILAEAGIYVFNAPVSDIRIMTREIVVDNQRVRSDCNQ